MSLVCKKIITVVLVMLTILSANLMTVHADSNSEQCSEVTLTRSTISGVVSYSTYFRFQGFTIYCESNLEAETESYLEITMELEVLRDDGFEVIETWNISSVGSQVSLLGDKFVNIIKTYRLKTTFTVGEESFVLYYQEPEE